MDVKGAQLRCAQGEFSPALQYRTLQDCGEETVLTFPTVKGSGDVGAGDILNRFTLFDLTAGFRLIGRLRGCNTTSFARDRSDDRVCPDHLAIELGG